MYNYITPHYQNGDIWQRKDQYYDQVIKSNSKRLSPHRTINLQQVPQPGIKNPQNSLGLSQVNSPLADKHQFVPVRDVGFSKLHDNNQSQIRPKLQQRPSVSQVNLNLKTKDPQRYKALEQRAQLYKKLQLVTLGLPMQQNIQETYLLSNNYILPHYKSQKITEIKEQQKKIKKLTAEMLQNEKVISKIERAKKLLGDRVNRIREIDQEIYQKLDQDRSKQIENYLRMATNLLAEGASEEKVVSVLKKILY